ncbi:MAG: hypothetical protein M0Z99_32035 [Betaproteobacteria bacterium]|nr:hypothetical protein [Betaproteobacteria bacterium]
MSHLSDTEDKAAAGWQEKHYLRLVLGLLVIGALLYAFWFFSRPKVDTTVAVEAPVAPVIAAVPKVDTPVNRGVVRTFKPTAKANLKLPEAVVKNDSQQVTSATIVAPSERRVTVTSVIDAQTGETTAYTKPEPYPWIAVESRGEARLDYGYKLTRGSVTPMPVGRLSVTHNFVQLKALHVGVSAALDTDGAAFVGVGLAYRW